MPNHEVSLTKDQILSALRELSERLQESGVIGEICLFGGTVMLLVFNARLSTRDVDAIFQPTALIRDFARQIAEEHHLPSAWLNDGVKGFQSAQPELTTESMPQYANLRVYRPSAEYLLAMKCLAARAPGAETGGDKADIITLALFLKFRTVEEITATLLRFFPAQHILPKTQFMIHEVVSEINRRAT